MNRTGLYFALALLFLSSKAIAGDECLPNGPGVPPAGASNDDCNGNGIPDWQDICECVSNGNPKWCRDTDRNGRPDGCDPWFCQSNNCPPNECPGGDCDSWCQEHPEDCQHCQHSPQCEDCNSNGVADITEVDSTPPFDDPWTQDCNNDGIPDMCQVNENGGYTVCEAGGCGVGTPLCAPCTAGRLGPPPPMCASACDDDIVPTCPPPVPPGSNCLPPPLGIPYIRATLENCRKIRVIVRACANYADPIFLMDMSGANPCPPDNNAQCWDPWSAETPDMSYDTLKIVDEQCANGETQKVYILTPHTNVPETVFVYWRHGSTPDCERCILAEPLTPVTPICIPCEPPQVAMDVEYYDVNGPSSGNQCRTLFRAFTCYPYHASIDYEVRNSQCQTCYQCGIPTIVWQNQIAIGNDRFEHVGEIVLDSSVTLPCQFEVRFGDGVARNNENGEDRWTEIPHPPGAPERPCHTDWIPVTINCTKPENLRASRDESGDITFKVDSCVPVRWEIVDNHGNCSSIADAQFIGDHTYSGRLTSCECLGYPAEEKKVTVRAYDGRTVAGAPNDCYAELTVALDYDCGKKDGVADLGSVLFRIDLGKNSRGIDVGDLEIRESQPSSLLESPLALKYPWTDPDVQIVRDASGGHIKQLRSHEVFVNVVTGPSGDHEYKMELYSFENATPVPNTPGVPPSSFTITGFPHTVWTVKNVGDAGTYDQIDFTQFVDPELSGDLSPRKCEKYRHLSGNGWRLQTYDIQEQTPQLMQTREVIWDGATEQRVTKDGNGADIARVHKTTSHTSDGRKIVEIAVDPDHANQLTRVTYYLPVDDAPERVQSIEEPSGAWRYFQYENPYNHTGFVSRICRPWLAGIPLSSLDPGNPEVPGVQVTTFIYGLPDSLRRLPYRAESRAPDDQGGFQTIMRTERSLSELGDGDGDGNPDVQIQEKHFTRYGPLGNAYLETLTTYRSHNDLRPTRIQRPDGTVTSISYQKGTATFSVSNPDASTFSASTSGLHERVLITEGDTEFVGGRAGKESRWEWYTGRSGERMLERSFVATANNNNLASGSFAQIGWAGTQHDPRLRPIKTTRSDNTVSERTWDNCCLASEEVDQRGTRRTTVHDVLGRVKRTILEGADETSEYEEQATIRTNLSYSKSGDLNQIAASISPLGLAIPTSPSLSISREFDLAGRMRGAFDTAGRLTEYVYPDALSVTITFPSGSEEKREFFVDGRIKRIYGSGVIERNYAYGVSGATGDLWSRVRIGEPDSQGSPSPRTITTHADLLGRMTRDERPGYGGNDTVAVVSAYHGTTGQLEKRFVELNGSGTPIQAPTLFEYDVPGRLARVGVDVDGNGALDGSSLDRITILPNPLITHIGGGSEWWVQSYSQAYQTDASGTLTTLATQRRQLTGLTGGTNATVARFETLDYYSNLNSTKIEINRGAKITTETTTVAGSTNPAITIYRNGLLQKTTGKDELTTSFGYDGFLRRTRVTDSREITWSMSYDSFGQVASSIAPGGAETTYSWDGTSGRLVWVKNSDKYTRYAFNTRGQPTRVWGHVPQPMQFEYDRFGAMKKLQTYRGGSSWSSSAWPEQSTGDDDVTSWEFDDATGLPKRKIYDNTSAVDLDYYPEGRLHTRTWAREFTSGQRVVATYAYDRADSAATGDLQSITYNDGTPTIEYTFDRNGRIKHVVDGFGARDLAYAASGPLLTEVFGSGSPLNGKQISTAYQDRVAWQDAPGTALRITDFVRLSSISVGPTSLPTQDYRATYDYDRDTDRMTKVTGPGLPSGGANYTYLADSPLVELMEFKTSSTTIASAKREYEDERHLLNGVLNHWYAGTGFDISHYSYRFDGLARRTDVLYTGQAFQLSGSNGSAGGHFDLWDHTDRNELTQVERYLGTDPDSPQLSNAQPALGRQYLYDNIGNRAQSTEGTQPSMFYCTNGVNTYTATDSAAGCQAPVTETFQPDADGNLKQDGTYKYEWDGENRLKLVEPVSPTSGSKQVKFSYDYSGRRTDKRVFDWNGSAFATTPSLHTRWIYFGWLPLLEFNVTYQNGIETSTIARKYTWGLDVSQTVSGAAGIGGLLATLDTSGTRTFLHFYDGNGNTGQLVETTTGTNYGTVAARYEYDAFGKSLLDPSNSTISGPYAATNSFRFSTKQFDVESGLGYWGMRYFDPRNGRWINRDPIAERGGANLFAYSRNSPTDIVDPFGLDIKVDSSEPQVECINGKWFYRVDHNVRKTGADAFTLGAALSAPFEWYYGVQLEESETVTQYVPYSNEADEIARMNHFVRDTACGLEESTTYNDRANRLRAANTTLIAAGTAVVGGALVGPAATVGGNVLSGMAIGGVSNVAGEAIPASVNGEYDQGVNVRALATAAAYGVTFGGLGGALAPTKACQCSNSSVTVYRVEGAPNTRVLIGEGGEVAIQGENALFLNFGDKARADAFLAQRLAQGMPEAVIKSFEVPRSVLTELQNSAVLESQVAANPGAPILVDVTKAPNQFGLRPPQIQQVQQQIIQGSGQVIR